MSKKKYRKIHKNIKLEKALHDGNEELAGYYRK